MPLMISKRTQLKIRRLLRRLKYHDTVRYSATWHKSHNEGRLLLQNFYFRDKYDDIWDDGVGGFIPNSSTRKILDEIISLLDEESIHRKFDTKECIITSLTYRQRMR